MPNRNVHIPVGIVAGAGTVAVRAWLREEKPDGWALIGGALGGGLGSLAPDWVDRPTGYAHRDIGHCVVAVGGATAVAWRKLTEWESSLLTLAAFAEESGDRLQSVLLRLLAGFVWGLPAGYVSHLVLDGGTPVGVPLLPTAACGQAFGTRRSGSSSDAGTPCSKSKLAHRIPRR